MFHPLKSLLSKSISRAGISHQIEDFRVLEIFEAVKNKILGSESSGKVKPMYIKNQVLTAASLSPETVARLESSEQEIVAGINSELGSEAVKKIKYIT